MNLTEGKWKELWLKKRILELQAGQNNDKRNELQPFNTIYVTIIIPKQTNRSDNPWDASATKQGSMRASVGKK